MKIEKPIISVSGIRGIVGESLNVRDILHFAQGFGKYIEGNTIAVGRDSRVSGEMYENAVISGLLSVGKKVVRLGIVSTPTLLLYVEKNNLDGGIVITSSHNPSQWNALKLVNHEGRFLNKDETNDFHKCLNNIQEVKWDEIKTIESDTYAADLHIKEILDLDIIDINRIREKRFKVVCDAVNGAGCYILPYLFEIMNCTYKMVHGVGDGIFERNPEPLNENLATVSEISKQWNADIGFAVDPDVDRLSIIDENGVPIGEELTLAIITDFILLQNKNAKIVTNLSTTSLLDFICAKHDAELIRTPVGEANVVSAMKENNALIGGEGNGGVIYPELHYTRDAVLGIALILQYLSSTGKEISDLINEYPVKYMLKEKISISEDFSFDDIKSKMSYRDIDERDGIKMFCDSESWIHIRKSGTEPVIRVYVEHNSQNEALELFSKIQKIIGS